MRRPVLKPLQNGIDKMGVEAFRAMKEKDVLVFYKKQTDENGLAAAEDARADKGTESRLTRWEPVEAPHARATQPRTALKTSPRIFQPERK